MAARYRFMRDRSIPMRVCSVLLAVFVTSTFACASSPAVDGPSGPVDVGTTTALVDVGTTAEGPDGPEPSDVGVPVASVVGSSSTVVGSTVAQAGGGVVGYEVEKGGGELLGVVPPCVPVAGSVVDPCPVDVLPLVDSYSVGGSSPGYVSDPPSASEIVAGLYPDFPLITPHIVIRATFLPGTTRCELYRVIDYNFEGSISYTTLHHYLCFVEVRVNEYYIGAGVSQLTVSVHGESFTTSDDFVWEDIEEDLEQELIHKFLGDPGSRTATAYEGREVVIFLRPTMTMAVESWAVEGTYDMWYVKKEGGGQEDTAGDGSIAAASQTESGTIRTGLRYGEHILLEMDLDDLATELRNLAPAEASSSAQEAGSAATISSSTTAGSSTSTSLPPMPALVRRSDQLRTFYVASGAVYEGENRTTVLPPPVPGQPTTTSSTVQ